MIRHKWHQMIQLTQQWRRGWPLLAAGALAAASAALPALPVAQAADKRPPARTGQAAGGSTAVSAGPSRHMTSSAGPVAPSRGLSRPRERTQTGGVYVYGLRKFPYPYQAMLAISSDADHETLRKFNLIHEFLNSTAWTPLGKGLGLDIADSFFMYNGSNSPRPVDVGHLSIRHEFTYFRGTSNQVYGGPVIDRYIHAGWLDTLHTYGDFSRTEPNRTLFRRSLAAQAIRALDDAGDRISIWTDHGNKANVDNFGSYGEQRFFNYQQGANPHSRYYHTDLLIPYGVHFVWSDQTSDIFGHDEAIYPIVLPDGQRVWGFWRYTNTNYNRRGAADWVWSMDNLARQLTKDHLTQLVRMHQYAVLAQHLCADNTANPLPSNAYWAFLRLAKFYHRGQILVARTSRLLQYNVSQEFLYYRVYRVGREAFIDIQSIDDPVLGKHVPSLDELRGITFYTSDPEHTVIEVDGCPVTPSLIQMNRSDGFAPSIGIRWYPPDTGDYAVWPRGIS